MTRSPVAAAWDLIHRFVPRGAILLSTLTFVGYFLGLVRERILSQSFGIGNELDAFKAAFLIPELLFSVIVASGLAAPFIPIFTGLKRDTGEPAAHDFGRSVLTLAVLVMGIVSVVLFIFAPLTADLVASRIRCRDAGAVHRSLPRHVLHPGLVRGIDGPGGGAHRRAALLLLRGGTAALQPRHRHRDGAAGRRDRHLRAGGRRGAREPRCTSASGSSASTRTTFRPWPRLHLRTPAIREFFRLLLPKAASGPLDPLLFIFFTSLASTIGGRGASRSSTRPATSRACRSASSA